VNNFTDFIAHLKCFGFLSRLNSYVLTDATMAVIDNYTGVDIKVVLALDPVSPPP
jgi:hypothetical protein